MSPRPGAPALAAGLLLALLGGQVHATDLAETDLPTLARRFAPVVRQDTASDQDYLAAFDFDGDWDGENNWENQPRFPQRAVVYWAGIETATHVYLTYAFFHPRDYTWWNNPLLSHENDLEGLLLVLEKGAALRPVAAETVFHLEFKRYSVAGGYPARGGDGQLPLDGERPVVFVEAKGHGVEAWDGGDFPGGDGVVYRYRGVAEVPEHPDDRDVGYDLVGIEETFWARRHEVGDHRAFGKAAAFGGEVFGYALNGKRYGDHKANAPWGWKAEGLPRGTFFLDPARMIAEHFEVPGAFGRAYLPNPYTGSSVARAQRAQVAFAALFPGAGTF